MVGFVFKMSADEIVGDRGCSLVSIPFVTDKSSVRFIKSTVFGSISAHFGSNEDENNVLYAQ